MDTTWENILKPTVKVLTHRHETEVVSFLLCYYGFSVPFMAFDQWGGPLGTFHPPLSFCFFISNAFHGPTTGQEEAAVVVF